jgi:hypothetical protein
MYDFDDVSNNAVTCEGVTVIVEDGEILDVKFVNDMELLMLLKTQGT